MDVGALSGQESDLILLVCPDLLLLYRANLALLALLLLLTMGVITFIDLNPSLPVFQNPIIANVDHLLVLTHVKVGVKAHASSIRCRRLDATRDEPISHQVKERVGSSFS